MAVKMEGVRVRVPVDDLEGALERSAKFGGQF